ncbi:MAG: hypothetical protein JWN08_2854 [Frankiales bacterium]|nr:hypothetical protein [Frankiales bacterium]MCW2816457.1 hypothetical protein [Nocardioides sp.]
MAGPRAGSEPEAAREAPPASPLQLCGSLERMAATRDDLVDGSPTTTMRDLRAAASRARSVGARTEGLGPQARAGLDYFTGLFLALPEQPTTEQLLSSGAPASVTDQAHADAFVSWLQGTCPQAGAPAA